MRRVSPPATAKERVISEQQSTQPYPREQRLRAELQQSKARVKELDEDCFLYLETFAGTSDCYCDPPGDEGDGDCTGMCYLRVVQNL